MVMSFAVDFDAKSGGVAKKIERQIFADGMLFAKTEVSRPLPQDVPEFQFGLGQVPPLLSGGLDSG